MLFVLAFGAFFIGQLAWEEAGRDTARFWVVVAVVKLIAAALAVYGARVAEGGDVLGLLKAPGLRRVAIGLVLYAVLLPLLIWLGVQRGVDEPVQESARAVLRGGLIPRLCMFLALVVATPLLEEVIFRGLVQTAVRRITSPLASIGISAALFMSVHPRVFWIDIVLLALVLGWVYDRSRSLWLPIVIHAVHNAIVFTLLVIS